ncbi:reactive intermediate imine deaminase A homolog UK114 [Leptinotarsa decemlineata]|uniref:reactive intermediate imine deaminase A homolog UK114 n=1 Tax=Leptinotarsa decemlineata TaxID=7539 RepID=UPI000C253267|nr:2-iminobutanoate/2-iminopropanoate deaminase-like [Leptinotarsa decemlineata]
MSNLVRRIISTIKAPAPLGGAPYNQAVVFNDVVYLSGVVGMNANTNKLVDGGAAAEAQQSLKNIGHILEAAGSSYANVLKSTIMLRNIDDFGPVNEVYKQFFKKDYPARSTFQVGKLPINAAVEIEVIAAIGNIKTVTSKL